MNSHRISAIIVGILFIVATVTGVISVLCYGEFLNAPVNLTLVFSNASQIAIGLVFYFIMAAVIPAIAIASYPVLKKYNEAWALGYVIARTGEGFFFMAQIIAMLAVLVLSRGAANGQSLADLMLIAGNWAYLFGFGFFFNLSALILNYVLFRSNLIPRWLSAWGFIGAVLISLHYLLVFFSNNTLNILFAPIAVQEMVFALWLIVKGFNLKGLAKS
jgi:hypothetical protein